MLSKCLCCKTNYQKTFDEKLMKKCSNKFSFSHHDTNRFILLLHEGVYQYEYMDDWGKIDKTYYRLLMQITPTRKEFVRTLK